jgi:hypothetical protein
MTWRNHKREFHKPIIDSKNDEYSLFNYVWRDGGCIGKFTVLFTIFSLLALILAFAVHSYFELFYYEVEFTKGDSYYVAPEAYKIEGNKIEFRSIIFDRKVEGYDFRLIEPIFK